MFSHREATVGQELLAQGPSAMNSTNLGIFAKIAWLTRIKRPWPLSAVRVPDVATSHLNTLGGCGGVAGSGRYWRQSVSHEY